MRQVNEWTSHEWLRQVNESKVSACLTRAIPHKRQPRSQGPQKKTRWHNIFACFSPKAPCGDNFVPFVSLGCLLTRDEQYPVQWNQYNGSHMRRHKLRQMCGYDLDFGIDWFMCVGFADLFAGILWSRPNEPNVFLYDEYMKIEQFVWA
jgi:hypothetical protein